MSHTRNDSQFAPEISQSHLGYVETINKNSSRGSLNEAEERQCQGTLARTGTTQKANLWR
jgi:hypothetical protein